MHCISVWIVLAAAVREDKINHLLSDHSMINWIPLENGAYATTTDLTPFLVNFSPALFITTDYFGGVGEQTAVLYYSAEHFEEMINDFGPINQGLKKIGIQRQGLLDEFDTIGLGNYRSNQDFK